MRLWDLPGVKRFIETACAPLRDGSSVVARFPGEIPTGFEEALTTSLETFCRWGDYAVPPRPLKTYATDLPRATAPISSLFRTCVKMKDLQDA